MIPMDRKTKHMSGGWRMRVSLAKALFAAPSLLLLDEPTNHLDLEACVWLENHLATYPKCLLVVSHSEDFLNTVCTNTVWMKPNPHGVAGHTLAYYGGNYDIYVKVTTDQERVELKLYEKQQADMEKLDSFVRKNICGKKTASSAKSKQKVLNKIADEAVQKPTVREQQLMFDFLEMDRIAPPVMPFDNVSFSYSGKEQEFLYDKLNLAVDYDSRIALVGPNGCGKSTLLKLMSGSLQPTKGTINLNPKLKLAYLNQHSADVLNLNASVFEFMRNYFPPSSILPGVNRPRSEEDWRSYLDRFGFRGELQNIPIGLLSHGQRARVVFAMVSMQPAGILLLDEPTNHLDLDAVTGLAKTINNFKGGVVLVSHDFRLIDQVAKDIWVCEKKGVTKFEGGDIRQYKRVLARKMEKMASKSLNAKK
jgi:ATP-binding cassette subfamily F protein 2